MSIEQLTTKINTVIEQEATARVAEQQELAAQVALVTQILEILRPAVRALGTRPLIAYTYAGATSTETHASWRGICLTGDAGPLKTVSGSRRAWPDTDTNGSYHGEDIFLTEDGLVELQYAGTWDQMDGSGNWSSAGSGNWSSAVVEYTVEKFCLIWGSADPERLLQTILALIDKAGDRHAKATEAANRHAEKFRALAALVKP